jgi:Fe-S-cluster containining protein
MIAIDDVLISDDILEKNFICNLTACKGACCWEGDYGAPVTKAEESSIAEHLHTFIDELPDESKKYLSKYKSSKYYREPKMLGTPLLRNKRCVFLTTNELGVSICGIEKAYKEGKSPINKPISCHLYPIRVTKNEEQKFEAWNYDRWDICSAACKLGNKHQVRIYQFLKEAIIRYKGEGFYEALEAYDNEYLNKKVTI